MDNLKAYWICGRGIDKFTATAYRKDFVLTKKCDNAFLNITATNRFVFWVNGEIVAYGPKRSHSGYKEYDRIDIGKFLKIGRNSFAVTVVYSPSCAVIKKDGLFVQADINYGNKTETVISDSSWVFAPAEWYGTNGLVISSGTELQEHFDSNKYVSNWQTEEYLEVPENAETFYAPSFWYKKAECGTYKPVTVLGPYYTAPWINLVQRTTSMSEYLDYKPNCVWCGNDSTQKYDIKENLAILFNNEEKSGKPVDIKKDYYNNQEYNIFVFDFFKTRTIQPGIIVNKLKGDARIELYYSIKLDETPFADRGFYGNNEGFCDTFIPNEANMKWLAVTAKGFRFLTVRIAGECDIEFATECKLVEYPFGEEKKPKIKSEILDKAWDIGAETIRSATTDYYVDTCWRENALWTYDACVTGKAAYDTFGEISLWRSSLLGISRSINEFGIPQSLAIPNSDLILIDQNLIWVCYCLEYYKLTNDIDFLKQVYKSIINLLNYCEKCITSDNLFIPPMGTWHYIDWAKLNKEPYSLPVNALYVLANTIASQIADVLGDGERKVEYLSRAEKVKTACLQFYDKQEGAFICHIEPNIEIGEYNKFSFKEDDLSGAYQYNIYANCLAIKAGIGTKKMQKSATNYVASRLGSKYSDWCDIGAGAFDLLLSSLLEFGKSKEIIGYLEKILDDYVVNKIPTFGETTRAGKYNSAHGWQSNINSLIKILAEQYDA